MRPRASIILVTYGKSAVTERCLESLRDTHGLELADGTLEIVVADNKSPDDTLKMLARWDDLVQVVALPENRDFSGGCNAGAAAARGEVLVFLNNDTVVAPNTLMPLVEQACEPGVGAAGLRLLYPDGTLQHGSVAMVGNFGSATPFHVFHHRDGNLPAARGVYECDVVTGACLAVRAEVFHEIGGFDEEYHNGFEDVDLCLRIRVSGHAVIYRGDLAIVHDEGSTRGGMDDTPNVRRMLATWSHLVEPDTAHAAHAWDSTLEFRSIDRDLAPTPIVVMGSPSGWGVASAEARSVLLALESVGTPAVACDTHPQTVRPRLTGPTQDVLLRGLRRRPPARATVIDVPDGPAALAAAPEGTWLRVRTMPAEPRGRFPIPAVPHPDGWVPPAIEAPASVGPGGGGVLVALPAHDGPRCDAILAALRDTPAPITLVPSIRDHVLAARVAAALPDAEVLGPFSDERHWVALAAAADVAVCLDVDDLFERAALGAAAAGASVIVPTLDGPATAVLGPALVTAADPGALPVILRDLPAPTAQERAVSSALVREQCDPAVVGARLAELVSAGQPLVRAA